MKSKSTVRASQSIAALVFAGLLIGVAHAADSPKTRSETSDVSTVLRAKLTERYPTLKIDTVEKTPISGIYEVVAGTDIAYADASGEYLLLGQLVETRSRNSLTAARLDQVTRIDFSTLPLSQALIKVKGDGKRKIAVFSDPDCPYCQQLEKDLVGLDNVTVYTFLFPLKNLHPDAERKAVAILCSAAPQDAWDAWMLNQTAPTPAAADCNRSVAANLELGVQLKVNVTPTIFFADGQRVGGALNAKQIEQRLLDASAKPPASAPPPAASN